MQIHSLTLQIKRLMHPLRPMLRHHFFFAVLCVLGFLIYTVWTVNETLGLPSDDAYRNQKQAAGVNSSFDQATIAKIRALKKSDEAPAATSPANGRTNPFAE